MLAAYPIKGNPYSLKFQVWSENTILANEAIAEGVLPLSELFRQAYDSSLGAPYAQLRTYSADLAGHVRVRAWT